MIVTTHLNLKHFSTKTRTTTTTKTFVVTHTQTRTHTPTKSTMCTTDVHTYVYPSGRRERHTQPSLCPNSRHGKPCANHSVYQHASQAVPYTSAMFSGPSSYPSYSSSSFFNRYPHSRSSTPYGSDSAGSSPRRRRHRDSGVYLGSRRDHIVFVDSPRTPPQTYTSMPSSPRPYIVEAHPPRKQKSHSRHSSYDSAWSKTSAEDTREARRDKVRELNERIARHNAEIASRPAVPLAVAPPKETLLRRSSTAAKKRLSGLERADDRLEDELLEAVRKLDLKEKKMDEKRGRLARKEEEDAERRRIRLSKVPTRRATSGPGATGRFVYADGLRRWEY